MISPMRKVIYIDSELVMPILIALFVGFWIWYVVSGILFKRKCKREIARAAQIEIAPGITLGEGVMACFGPDSTWNYRSGEVGILAYGREKYPYACFSVELATGGFDVPVFCPAQGVIEYSEQIRRNALSTPSPRR